MTYSDINPAWDNLQRQRTQDARDREVLSGCLHCRYYIPNPRYQSTPACRCVQGCVFESRGGQQ